MKPTKFTILGGDLRSVSACNYIIEKGYSANTYLLDNAPLLSNELKCEKLPLSDVYILGIPSSSDGISINAPLSKSSMSLADFFNVIPKSSIVMGGLLSSEIYTMAQNRDIKIIDYYSSEELQIKNAVPTAEGALEIAMRETALTISDTKSLIIGYGRIAKALARILKALGSDVCISSKNPSSLAWCDVSGYKSTHLSGLSGVLSCYDLIFNTVPVKIISENELKKIKNGALVIDLASRPGGVDMEKAAQLGVRVIWALGLPGKCAPVSSGRIIADTVLNSVCGR